MLKGSIVRLPKCKNFQHLPKVIFPGVYKVPYSPPQIFNRNKDPALIVHPHGKWREGGKIFKSDREEYQGG